MGRNRFVSAEMDVNCFRSNLMLLVNNLYVQGLPMSKLRTEYKKYFHEDINAESLSKSLGLNLAAIAAKQNKENTITEIWSSVFSTPCLYEFFSVEEVTTNDGDTAEEMATEYLIKCRRGRTVQEMTILARLASFRNIEFIRSKGKGKLMEGVDAVLDLCENVNSEDNCPSLEVCVLKDSSNPLKRKFITIENDETKDGRKTAAKMSARPPSSLPLQTSRHQEVFDKPMEITDTNVVESQIKMPSLNSNVDTDENCGTPIEPLVLAGTSTADYSSTGTGHPGELIGEREDTIANTNEALTTIVIKNYKGETKILKYLKVEHICKRCSQSYPNEVLLAQHKKLCTANLERKCITCGVWFSTVAKLEVHERECKKAIKGHNMDHITDVQGDEQTFTQAPETIDLVDDTPNTGPHIVLVSQDGAVCTRTRLSLTKTSND